MEKDYDYIVIGSGFGGSVSALRLSEKGYKVLVVEKGKWYKQHDFAKSNWNFRKWLWIPIFRCFGIMKITFFRHINVLSGVGVGGGSLVYANTLPIPKAAFFKTGSWSTLSNWQEDLKPHYRTALNMLGATENPQLFDGDLALKKLARENGILDRFSPTNVAVFFGTANETVADPYFNGKGPSRTGCNFCGACMTGCRNNSKNTLDKNYLHLAQLNGVKIIAEKKVIEVRPLDKSNGESGYEVTLQDSTKVFKNRQSYTASGVIFSGGVLGTVKLLLKLKKTTLPRLSSKVGHDIRTNNETLITVASTNRDLNLSKGVAIGSILHTDDHSHLEICRYAEGSNAWKQLHLPYSTMKNPVMRLFHSLSLIIFSPIKYLKAYLSKDWAKKTVVLLFMQTLDSTLQFKEGFMGRIRSTVGKGKNPTPYIEESIKLTHKYAELIDGLPFSFAGEALSGIPSTAHILGGSVMGSDIYNGVIDKENKVFGYENMYVIDGSMISANPGVNPSLSIAAIAEHAMSKIPKKAEK